jgi:magnesium transporter
MGRVVAAAVYSEGKKVTNIALDEGAAWAAKPGHFVWIGLEEPDTGIIQPATSVQLA